MTHHKPEASSVSRVNAQVKVRIFHIRSCEPCVLFQEWYWCQHNHMEIFLIEPFSLMMKRHPLNIPHCKRDSTPPRRGSPCEKGPWIGIGKGKKLDGIARMDDFQHSLVHCYCTSTVGKRVLDSHQRIFEDWVEMSLTMLCNSWASHQKYLWQGVNPGSCG